MGGSLKNYANLAREGTRLPVQRACEASPRLLSPYHGHIMVLFLEAALFSSVPCSLGRAETVGDRLKGPEEPGADGP